ncbi:hypothetical protein Tco_0131558, partial [Tanacetum coccineum]
GSTATVPPSDIYNTARMALSSCLFNPPNGAISWERLECLCLFCVTLDENMIEKVLSGSPCLEYSELNYCYGYSRIDITSESVKKLVFSDYYSNHGINSVGIFKLLTINHEYAVDNKHV